MKATVVVSIRLDPQTSQALTRAAEAAQRSVSGHAADLIRAGLSGDSPGRVRGGTSSLVDDIERRFAFMVGHDVAARQELALILSQVAAAGGAPAVGAVKELRSMLDELERMTDGDDFGSVVSA